MKITPEALAEWRGSLTTERVLECLRATCRYKRNAAQAAYWAGNPWPEHERLALIQSERWLDDMATASAEDFDAAMESDDGKHERANAN